MSEDIKKKIYNIIEKYRDPATKKYFSSDDSIINISHKDGHLNISIDIDPAHSNQYEELKEKISRDVKKLEGVLSTNIILTSEKKANNQNLSNNKFFVSSKTS